MRTAVVSRISPRAIVVGLLLLGTNGWAQVPGEKISGGAVSRAGMDHVSRPLERMESPGATSYGAFFDLRQPGPYRIRIEVARPGSPVPAAAEFDYSNR